MKIKVCGLKDAENIKAVAALNPDYMGFIFYSLTPRFADGLPEGALAAIPAFIHKTAVFVNENEDNINALIDKYNFDTIQLHGNESPEFCGLFKGRGTVLKAFGINETFNFEQLSEYAGKVDYFLFDTKTVIHGGSGKSFDWALLNQYKLNIPFFLSGGIGPDSLDEVKSIEHPQFYGVDLNSKFELSPGIKDINKLEAAFNSLKQIQYK
jgi:phosphoribosylanthranilate isomerase